MFSCTTYNLQYMIPTIPCNRLNNAFVKVRLNLSQAYSDNIQSFSSLKSMKINIPIFKLKLVVLDLKYLHLSSMLALFIILSEEFSFSQGFFHQLVVCHLLSFLVFFKIMLSLLMCPNYFIPCILIYILSLIISASLEIEVMKFPQNFSCPKSIIVLYIIAKFLISIEFRFIFFILLTSFSKLFIE